MQAGICHPLLSCVLPDVWAGDPDHLDLPALLDSVLVGVCCLHHLVVVGCTNLQHRWEERLASSLGKRLELVEVVQ